MRARSSTETLNTVEQQSCRRSGASSVVAEKQLSRVAEKQLSRVAEEAAVLLALWLLLSTQHATRNAPAVHTAAAELVRCCFD